MGLYYRSIPEQVLKNIKAATNYNIFVETGTLDGASALLARKYFDTVYTIEADEAMFRKYNAGLVANGINHMFGESQKELPNIIQSLELDGVAGGVVYWLDAHYSGPGTHGEDNICPLFDEIQIITFCDTYNPLILIDDARLFENKTPGFPAIDEIIELLCDVISYKYTIKIEKDIIFILPKLKELEGFLYCM